MPRITKITYMDDRDKHWVFVDGEYCCSVRGRTFPALDLRVGQEISCAEIEEMEKFHWKRAYGKASWEAEKVRLDRVKQLIEMIDPRLSVHVTGFGADTDEFIAEHPDEAGAPDLEVREGDRVLALVEVTGTKRFRGGTPLTYWVRPDKLEYARNHPEQDVWIILHYAEPTEQIVVIRPDNTKEYMASEEVIGNATEHFVTFTDSDPECVTPATFAAYVRNQL